MEFLDGSGNGTPGLFWNKVAKLHLDYFLFIITIINIFFKPSKNEGRKKIEKVKKNGEANVPSGRPLINISIIIKYIFIVQVCTVPQQCKFFASFYV